MVFVCSFLLFRNFEAWRNTVSVRGLSDRRAQYGDLPLESETCNFCIVMLSPSLWCDKFWKLFSVANDLGKILVHTQEGVKYVERVVEGRCAVREGSSKLVCARNCARLLALLVATRLARRVRVRE